VDAGRVSAERHRAGLLSGAGVLRRSEGRPRAPRRGGSARRGRPAHRRGDSEEGREEGAGGVMLLSRFWYVVLALLLGAAVFVLSLAQSMFNRAGARSMGEALSSDSQFVSWYLKDDARMRSAHLVKFALNSTIAKALHEASKSETELKSSLRDEVRKALKEVNADIPEDQAFDAVFAIDQHGRV